MPKCKEDILIMYAKWYQKNSNCEFAKTLNEVERAISKEMVNGLTTKIFDYISLAERLKIAVAIITGTRRNMVERWKKTVQKKDVTSLKVDSIKLRIKLKELRESHGFTHQELSKKVGISRSAIHSWESFWTNPNLDNLLTLAEFYMISLNDLLLQCLYN